MGQGGKLFGGHSFSFFSLSHSKLQNVNMILFGAIPDATNAFPAFLSPLFITAVKDICTVNTFEKLLHISFSEGYCWHFGFTTQLLSATTTDLSIYEVLRLFLRWPLIFQSIFLFRQCLIFVVNTVTTCSKDLARTISWTKVTSTVILATYLKLTQGSPYQAVTGKIYCL